MAKIFLSHSTKNKELVENFIEFLQLALGISRGDIFCTIAVEELYTGENFMERIRKELQDSTAVISLITEEYLGAKCVSLKWEPDGVWRGNVLSRLRRFRLSGLRTCRLPECRFGRWTGMG